MLFIFILVVLIIPAIFCYVSFKIWRERIIFSGSMLSNIQIFMFFLNWILPVLLLTDIIHDFTFVLKVLILTNIIILLITFVMIKINNKHVMTHRFKVEIWIYYIILPFITLGLYTYSIFMNLF